MLILRHIAIEITKMMLVVLSFLTLILISNRVIIVFSRAVSGKVPVETILHAIVLQLPEILSVLIPISFALSILFAFYRMYSNSEINVIYTSGFSQTQIVRLLIVFGCVILFISAFLAIYLSPLSKASMKQLIEEHKAIAAVSLISAGQFRKMPGGRGVIYVEEVKGEGDGISGVFLAQPVVTKNKTTFNILVAKTGEQALDKESGMNVLSLKEGVQYQGGAGDKQFTITQFDLLKYFFTFGADSIRLRSSAKPMTELWSSSDPDDLSELAWRISVPLASLILVFLVVPIIRPGQRKDRIGRIVLSSLAVVGYFVLIVVACSLVENSGWNPFLAISMVHCAFLSIGLVLLIEPFQWHYLKNKFFQKVSD